MRVRTVSKFEFQKPWRVLAPDADDVYLAGGRNPSRGRRSEYSRSVAKLDRSSGQFVWESEQTGSRPYSDIAVTHDTIAVVVSSNFNYAPFGVFFFDKQGQLLSQQSGVAVQHVVALAGGTIISVYMHGGAIGFIERDADGNIKERPLFDEGFDLCGCKRVEKGFIVTVSPHSAPNRYEHIFFETDNRQRWSISSALRHVTTMQEAIVLYGDAKDGITKLQFVDFASGEQIHSTDIASPVWSPVWISPTLLVTHSNQSELALVNLSEQSIQKIPFDPRISFFDLAYSEASQQLTVLGSSNPMCSYSAMHVLEIS